MPDDSLFRYVPITIINAVEKSQCSECGSSIRKEDIIAVGIRKTLEGYALCAEHTCRKCTYRQIVVMDNKIGTVEDLCFILLDYVRRVKSSSTGTADDLEQKKIDKNWTNREVSEFLKFMANSKSFEDLLKHIGAIT